MNAPSHNAWLPWMAVGSLLLVGCNKLAPAAAPPAPKPPEVDVCLPTSGEVVDYEDFTGQTDAVEMVEIRSRVTGYLDDIKFDHGAEVEAGKLLFEVDPRSYEAELERASAAISQSEARLKRLRSDHRRAESAVATGGITREKFDQVAADLADAEAGLKSARASKDLAELNLSYTKVLAPISGRVSEPFIDKGNLVKGDDTILTRIVSLDPMYVYFDIDERTMLRLRRRGQEDSRVTTAAREIGRSKNGSKPAATSENLTITMQLADEDEFSHQGELDFEENRIDSGTGTLRVRAVFDNAERLLSPGLFVRVRLPIGEPHQAIMIPERAIGTDQGQKFVFVIDEKNQAQYRRIKVGRLHQGLREIKEGLKPTEQIVVTGLQRVRPGAEVAPKLIETTGTSTVAN